MGQLSVLIAMLLPFSIPGWGAWDRRYDTAGG